MDWISLSFVNGYAKILEKALLDTVIRIDLMISEEGENTMAKTKVICFTNNKGGSGKTTTCSNVGFGLRELGKKVLMIDGDMQLNLSLSLFDEDTVLAYAQSDKNLYEAIKRQDDLTDYIVNTKYEGLDLIPSSTLMSSIEYELFTKWQREYILKKGLKKIRESEVYDYILIDCPPQLSILTINALSCADGVLIPVKTDYLAYRGLTQLQDSIREIQELINPDLKVLGVIATLYDARLSDDKDILALLKEEYNLVGVVKRLAVAKKGIYDGLAVVEQAPSSEIAKEYTAIAKMIINGNFDREDIENG